MSQDFLVAKFRQSLLAVFACSAVGTASLWLPNIPSQPASAQALGGARLFTSGGRIRIGLSTDG